MPVFRLACLAYFSVALPSSTLGLLWPSIRLSFHQPVAALGVLLAFGITATVVASTITGRLLPRLPAASLVATGTALTAAALAAEALAPAIWAFACGMVVFGLGFGAVDAAVNVYAARHFSARQINWMHASYGAGATVGPLLATLMLTNALTWHWVYGILGGAQAVLAVVFSMTSTAWAAPRPAVASAPRPARPALRPGSRPRPSLAAWGALTFVAVENGIESGAGIWGYVFLTQGRGLTDAAAGAALSAYWAMMFLGRIVFGAVAGRVGPSRLLGAAVAVVSVGCALMTLPGPGLLAVAGLMVLGLAAAPIFPLFTLTTAERVGADGATRMVSLQVAASAAGSAALPAGIGLAIGAFTATALGPWLLLPSLSMYALYRLLTRAPGRVQVSRPDLPIGGQVTAMPMKIGTSGWQYRDWRGGLYPPGVPQRLWLEQYAQRYLTVENNNSFYRLPSRETFESWRERTPDDFVMAVKASRYLTHVRRLRDPAEPVARLLGAATGLGRKLGPVLLQLPPTLKADPDLLDGCLKEFRTAAVALGERGQRVAVEPRHDSWWTEGTRQVLASHDAALCWADRRSRPITPLWRTATWGYLRFHEGTARPWPRYGPQALRSWVTRLADTWPDEADVYVYFNNDQGGAAVVNSAQFADLARRAGRTVSRAPEVG